ncbi:MAG: V4R domain-containing protein [Infirmifilum uzonense]|uniref:V4R domain-containing protein n=1 Tax=Infirmifilum TaxID=2856573 RepID=UPI0023559D91
MALLRQVEEISARMQEALSEWRRRYNKELVNGPSRARLEKPKPEDFLIEKRPFFSSVTESDVYYVNTFRLIEYTALTSAPSPSKVALMRKSGYNLGRSLVRSGVVKSLDDAPLALVLYRVGLLDIVKESLDTMRVNLYECTSCYGVPNIGQTLCDFEAGVIQGMLSELYGRNVVREKYCWGTGYSFCGFEIAFE